jgi:hypothetical protein
VSTQKVKPGEVIGSALEIYREQASVLISVAVIVFAITALAQLTLTGGPAVFLSLLGMAIVVFYQGMVVELVGDIQNGRSDSSVGQLFRSVAPVVLPLIGLSILWDFAVAIGFILLVVPGLVLITIWSVAAQALVIERQGVLASFGRSRELVRGHGWQAFSVILFVFGLDVAVGIVADIIAAGLGDTGRTLLQWVLYVLVSPLTALISAVLYFSLRRVHGELVMTDVSTDGPTTTLR